MGPVRILIVDGFEPWRRTVRSILAGDPSMRVVGECSNGLDSVRKAETLRPDLVLLDIQLVDLNGFIAAQKITKTSPQTKILFLSAQEPLRNLQEALGIGVGFVLKEDAERKLLSVIRGISPDEPIRSIGAKDNNLKGSNLS